VSNVIKIFKELLKYRSLVAALVQRHLAIRYRGSALGFLWSFLNPLCLIAVYALVFKYYIRFSEVEHYTVFLFCGLLPWLWTTSSLLEGTASIVSGGHLITKSMFPAHILPAVSVITNFVNFVLSWPILFGFMLVSGVGVTPAIFLLPIGCALHLLILHGLTLSLSALNVQFRDVQHILGNALTFLFFLCPILYPVTTVPEKFRFTIDYNPLAQLTIFYQDVLFHGIVPPLWTFGVLGIFALLCTIVGAVIYRRHAETFAELL